MIDPWFNPAFAHPRHYNGGGYLFYPGAPCGIDGPVASMRLKNLRDGMEDYEYFVLLEKRAGAEAVQKVGRPHRAELVGLQPRSRTRSSPHGAKWPSRSWITGNLAVFSRAVAVNADPDGMRISVAME